MRFLAILLLSVSTAFAHDGAHGVVKERMDNMKSIAAIMKELTSIAKSETRDPSRIRALALELESRAGLDMLSAFPPGSLQEPTEAIEKIWLNPEPFAAQAYALEAVARVIANDPSELDASLRAAGETCKACHKDYRVKN